MFYWFVLRTGAHPTSNYLRSPPEDVSYFLISCSLLILSNLLHKQNSKLCLLLHLRLGLVSVWRNLGFSIGKEDLARFLTPVSIVSLKVFDGFYVHSTLSS